MQVLLGTFRWGWGFALLVFAAHLALVGALVLRSR